MAFKTDPECSLPKFAPVSRRTVYLFCDTLTFLIYQKVLGQNIYMYTVKSQWLNTVLLICIGHANRMCLVIKHMLDVLSDGRVYDCVYVYVLSMK